MYRLSLTVVLVACGASDAAPSAPTSAIVEGSPTGSVDESASDNTERISLPGGQAYYRRAQDEGQPIVLGFDTEDGHSLELRVDDSPLAYAGVTPIVRTGAHFADANGDGSPELYFRHFDGELADWHALYDANGARLMNESPPSWTGPTLLYLSRHIDEDARPILERWWLDGDPSNMPEVFHQELGDARFMRAEATRRSSIVLRTNTGEVLFNRRFTLGGENGCFADARLLDTNGDGDEEIVLLAKQGYASDCTEIPQQLWRFTSAGPERIGVGRTHQCESEAPSFGTHIPSAIERRLHALSDRCSASVGTCP